MKLFAVILLGLFSSLAHAEYDIIELPSENYGCNEKNTGRGELKPNLLIAHCMGTEFEHSLRILTLPVEKNGGGVSAHYFIPQLTAQEIRERYPQYIQGTEIKFPNHVPVFRLVKEEDRAWHAGPSKWGNLNLLPGCAAGLNSCSIGIEFHSPGYANGDGSNWFVFKEYSAAQIETGRELIRDIFDRWKLTQANFIGHSDCAPTRKTDPGLNFPWETFAQQGFGSWWKPVLELPKLAEEGKVGFIQSQLKAIGYECPQTGQLDADTQRVISAFRMHFMPQTWKCSNGQQDDGILNGQVDEELIKHLAGYAGGNVLR